MNDIITLDQNVLPAIDTGLVKMSQLQIFNAINEAIPLGDVKENEVINVAGYMRTTCNISKQDGSILENHPLLYIITSDGKTIACVSTTFQRRFIQLIELFGRPSSWPAPIPITIKKVPSNNKVFYAVSIVEDK